MKVIDCFTFFNELDLLEFRFKLLDAHIDHFVIAESNLTHSGKPKPFYFTEHKNRFEPWLHKISCIQVNQSAEGLDLVKEETGYNPQSAAWKLENEHRNALSAAGKLAADDDMVVISDLDEIPDPAALKKISLQNGPVALSMLFHYYFFNCQNTGKERWWNGSIVCSGKQFRETTPQHLRDNRNAYKSVPKSGWHFSYLGGVEKIKYKIRSFAHTEYNKEDFLKDENIIKAMEEGRDIFNRPDMKYKFVPLYHYPSRLSELMQQYPAFLHLGHRDDFFKRLFYYLKKPFSR